MKRIVKILLALICVISLLSILIGVAATIYVLKPAKSCSEAEMVVINASDGIDLFAVESVQKNKTHKWG